MCFGLCVRAYLAVCERGRAFSSPFPECLKPETGKALKSAPIDSDELFTLSIQAMQWPHVRHVQRLLLLHAHLSSAGGGKERGGAGGVGGGVVT